MEIPAIQESQAKVFPDTPEFRESPRLVTPESLGNLATREARDIQGNRVTPDNLVIQELELPGSPESPDSLVIREVLEGLGIQARRLTPESQDFRQRRAVVPQHRLATF